MTDLCVIVPSRGRPQNIARLIQAWKDTEAEADLFVCFDEDDPKCDEYWDLLIEAKFPVINCGPRKRLVSWLNLVTSQIADRYFAVAFMGDDHCPKTKHWDQALVYALQQMRTGFAYGNDLLQGQALATAWFMTSDIVKTFGYMIPPCLTHFYADNFIMDAGSAIGRLSYMPNVILEHLHPLIGKALEDGAYRESWSHEDADKATYEKYKADGSFDADVAKLKALING